MPSVGVFGIIHRYIFRFHPERFLYVLTIFSRCLKKLIHELLIQFLRNPSSTNFYINITGFQRFRHGSLQCLHIFSKSAVFFCIVFSNVKFLTNITWKIFACRLIGVGIWYKKNLAFKFWNQHFFWHIRQFWHIGKVNLCGFRHGDCKCFQCRIYVFNRLWRSDSSFGKNIRLCNQLVLINILFKGKKQIVGAIITQNRTVFAAVQKPILLVKIIILNREFLLNCFNLTFGTVICLYFEKFTNRISQINECSHTVVVFRFCIHYFGNIKISKLAFSAFEINIVLIIFEKTERAKFSSCHCDLFITESEYLIRFYSWNLRIQFLYRFMNLLSKICAFNRNAHCIIISAVKLVALYYRTKYHFRIFRKVAVYLESVLSFAKMYPIRQFFRRCGTLL